MLVAVDGGQVVGIGNADLRGAVPIIWKLYVLPQVQGSGVGSALLTALLNRDPAGTGSLQLEYLDGNERAAASMRPGDSLSCGGSQASGRGGQTRCGSSAGWHPTRRSDADHYEPG